MSVAVVGSYGVGLTFSVSRMPELGETLAAGALSVSHGGKGSNQAVGAARLGMETLLLSCVGRDRAGSDAVDMWLAEGVTATAVLADLPTMTGAIFVESGGDNRIVIAPGASAELRPEDVDGFAEQLADADICLVSLEIPLETAVRALEVARRVGTRTVLNPAPAPARRLTRYELSLADIITPNLGEARSLSPAAQGSWADAVASLRKNYDGSIVVTLGSQGAYIADRAGLRLVPAFGVPEVVDTTGAGDAFNASLVVSLVEGAGIDAAVLRANAAAAHAVGVREVVPSLPRPSDIDRVMRGSTPCAG